MADSPLGFSDTHNAIPLQKQVEPLREAELISSTDWFIRLRWLAAVGILVGAFLVGPVLQLEMPASYFAWIGFIVLLYNMILSYIARRYRQVSAPLSSFSRLVITQIALDWLSMGLLIHYSGGVESPVIFFFVFHVVIAATFFSTIISFALTTVAIFILTGISLAEYFEIIPHIAIGYLKDFPLYSDPLYIIAVLVFFSSTVLVITFLVSTISERLRKREAQVVNLGAHLLQSSARLQALNESARAINSTLELNEVLNRLVKNTAEAMSIRACSIRLLDKTGKSLEPVAAYGLSQAYMDKGPLELDSDPLDRKVLEGEVINLPDASQSSLLQYPEWAAQEGFFSMISAPLIGKNKPLGVLRAYAETKDHFSSDDELFLSAIAAQGSSAIENALAFQTIESLDATKAAYIRVFTHELRSPVSVTRSLLQTLSDGYVGEITNQQKDIVDRAIRRIEFLQKLIDDLLDLAAGKTPYSTGEVSEGVALEEVVDQVYKRFQVPAQEKNIELLCQDEAESGVTRIWATVEGLDRICNNLVSNAIKYTPEGGQVTIILRRDQEKAYICVRDTGIGIPKESINHLFEEFYRAPNAKAVQREGTGLGLSIVKETVTSFGGDVSVESELGKGTTITITIPLISNI
jgi:signal transduction histidine kinase